MQHISVLHIILRAFNYFINNKIYSDKIFDILKILSPYIDKYTPIVNKNGETILDILFVGLDELTKMSKIYEVLSIFKSMNTISKETIKDYINNKQKTEINKIKNELEQISKTNSSYVNNNNEDLTEINYKKRETSLKEQLEEKTQQFETILTILNTSSYTEETNPAFGF